MLTFQEKVKRGGGGGVLALLKPEKQGQRADNRPSHLSGKGSKETAPAG